jgi:hypothetical protein
MLEGTTHKQGPYYRLQINITTDIRTEKQAAAIKEKDADLNKWTTLFGRCNKNFKKFKENLNRKILIDLI